MKDDNFNESLKAKLLAEGYTLEEMVLATFLGEFKAGLKMLTTAKTHMQAVISGAALSGTFSNVIGMLADAKKVSADRLVELTEKITNTIEEKAKEDFQRMQPFKGMMDDSGPANPSQVN